MINTFLESIQEGGEADEAQRAVTEAMIDLVEGSRVREPIDEAKWTRRRRRQVGLPLRGDIGRLPLRP